MKQIITIILFAFICIFSNAQNQSFNVLTNINNLSSGYSGDGGLAKVAQNSNVSGMAFDSYGNMYLVDQQNFVIRKITKSTGIITRFAGDHNNAFTITTGTNTLPPTSYSINLLSGIAIDNNDNIYFSSGYYICKLNIATSNLSIIAGTGLASGINPKFLKFDNTFSNLFFYDQTTNGIRRLNISSKNVYNVLSNTTGINSLQVYGNNLYYCDGQIIYKYNMVTLTKTVFDQIILSGNTFGEIGCDQNGDVYAIYTDGFSFSTNLNKYAGVTPASTIIIRNGVGNTRCMNPSCLDGQSAINGEIGGSITFDLCNNMYLNCPSFVAEVSNANLFGTITHPTNGIVKNVNVNITGGENDNLFITNGQVNWSPRIPNATSTYVVTPSKNNDLTKSNGVTALDLALIQSHILGTNLFNNPYKCFAADVTNDGQINTLDIVYIKRLILGIDTTFAGNRLWSFINTDATFSDPNNPFGSCSLGLYTNAFNRTINANCLTTGQSFYGVKLGDVNWDWNPAIPRPTVGSNTDVKLHYNGLPNTNGNTLHVPITVKNLKNIMSLEFTLNFNPAVLKWKGILNPSLNIETGTSNVDSGKVSFLWIDSLNTIKSIGDDNNLVDLVFEKLGDYSNEQLTLSDDLIPTFALDQSFSKRNITLTKSTTSSFTSSSSLIKESLLISPNPTSNGIINVQLQLKENKAVNFSLVDLRGRIVLQQKMECVKGNNTISLQSNQLKIPAGMYYLKTSEIEEDMIKMVMVQ